MKLTAACLLLLSCGLSFGANISFRGIAEGSHAYSPISGSTNSSSGGGGSATNLTPWTSDINGSGYRLTNAGGVSIAGSGSGSLYLGSSNALGGMAFTVGAALPVNITNIFNFTNAAAGQVLTVISSNNYVITWGLSNTPSSSGGGIGSFPVNANQLSTNGGVVSVITSAYLTNAVMFGTWLLEGTFNMGDVLASSSILRSDVNGDLSTVTIGSGLSFDGTTLSASGASQTPWSSDIDGAGFSLTNGNRAQFQVVYFNTNRNSYVSNDFINGRTYHYVSNALAFVESYHGPSGSGIGISTNDSQFYSLNVGVGVLGSAAFAGGSVLVNNSGSIFAPNLNSNSSPVNALGQLSTGEFVKMEVSSGGTLPNGLMTNFINAAFGNTNIPTKTGFTFDTNGTMTAWATNTAGAVTAWRHRFTNNVEEISYSYNGGVFTNVAKITTNGLTLRNGSASFPALGWFEDDDGSGTGFYRDTANKIDMTLNGTASAEFNSSGLYLAGDRIGLQGFGGPNTFLVSEDNGQAYIKDATSNLGTLRGQNFWAKNNVVTTNGFAAYSTNIVPSVNAAGYTNSTVSPGTGTGIAMMVNITGTSGTYVYYHRSGVIGGTVCGTPLYTNSIQTVGSPVPVGVNCGIQVVSGIGVTLQAYPFP